MSVTRSLNHGNVITCVVTDKVTQTLGDLRQLDLSIPKLKKTIRLNITLVKV